WGLHPAPDTCTACDAGSHTFSDGVTLQTTSYQTVSAQDTVTTSIQGSASVSVINPVPSISSLSQNSAAEGSPALPVTINGSGFVPTSTAQWNGLALTTTFVSMTSLQASIPVSDLAEEGTAQVGVVIPSPG